MKTATKTNRQKQQVFSSVAEIEKRYFPESAATSKESREPDADTLGKMLARSSLAKVKILLGRE